MAWSQGDALLLIGRLKGRGLVAKMKVRRTSGHPGAVDDISGRGLGIPVLGKNSRAESSKALRRIRACSARETLAVTTRFSAPLKKKSCTCRLAGVPSGLVPSPLLDAETSVGNGGRGDVAQVVAPLPGLDREPVC